MRSGEVPGSRSGNLSLLTLDALTKAKKELKEKLNKIPPMLNKPATTGGTDNASLAASNPYFDPRMGIDRTKLLRPKRRMSFQSVEQGRWLKQAKTIKFKSQFDIPDIEWWDKPFLSSGGYIDEKITIYIQHPQPIEPRADPAPPPPQPLKLTKKELKKLRTQRRLARERDRQEMIRHDLLLEPPKPKVKMSNLMKVLGSEAIQDPTRLEMEIRRAAAEREQAHVDRNIARKLTPAERREKKMRKQFEDHNAKRFH